MSHSWYEKGSELESSGSTVCETYIRYFPVRTQPGWVYSLPEILKSYFPCFHLNMNELFSSYLLEQEKEVIFRPKSFRDPKTHETHFAPDQFSIYL